MSFSDGTPTLPGPKLFELSRREQVGLIDDDHDAAVTLGLLRLQQFLGLGHDFGFEDTGLGAKGTNHGDVETAGAEGGMRGKKLRRHRPGPGNQPVVYKTGQHGSGTAGGAQRRQSRRSRGGWSGGPSVTSEWSATGPKTTWRVG